MENLEKIAVLRNAFADISVKLGEELLRAIPDVSALKAYRKQLSQLDKDISRIQRRRDIVF